MYYIIYYITYSSLRPRPGACAVKYAERLPGAGVAARPFPSSFV